MSTKSALNIAKVAMQKYFVEAMRLQEGSSLSAIESTRNDAIAKIKDFASAKRDAKEMSLTPYEEKSLGTFDAADMIVMHKTHLSEDQLYGGGKHGNVYRLRRIMFK